MPDPDEDFGEPPLDEVHYRIDGLLKKGGRAEYAYDFGDGWQHLIAVEDVVPLDAGAPRAECLAGARASPPEDCGGPHAYAELLDAIADPSHERHEDLQEWVGPHFAPEGLDLALVNQELRGAGTENWRRKRERFYDSR